MNQANNNSIEDSPQEVIYLILTNNCQVISMLETKCVGDKIEMLVTDLIN